MLCITRRYQQVVVISLPDGREIKVHVDKTRSSAAVRFYFECDRDILIKREELSDENVQQAIEVSE